MLSWCLKALDDVTELKPSQSLGVYAPIYVSFLKYQVLCHLWPHDIDAAGPQTTTQKHSHTEPEGIGGWLSSRGMRGKCCCPLWCIHTKCYMYGGCGGSGGVRIPV